jgi:glycosyltransferase involved in cell wall biosynthesis
MENWQLGLLAITYLAALAQAIWWLMVWLSVRYTKRVEQPVGLPPVSIVVCVRNGAANLERLLPLLIAQEYPAFEIVLVNDASTDQTADVLDKWTVLEQCLHPVHLVEKTAPGKKEALRAGILAARHEVLLMTDVDCMPTSPDWIRLMVASLNDKADVVLGLGPLYSNSKTWLDYVQQYETWLVATTYTTAAFVGRPYMAVGRNVMYRKRFAGKLDFDTHMDLASGDDDLLLNPLLSARSVAVQTHPAAQCRSLTAPTWQAWRLQKLRHISTASRYRLLDQGALVALQGAHLGATLLTVCCFVLGLGSWQLILIWLLGRLLWLASRVASWRVWAWPMQFWRTFLIDLCWPVYYLWLMPALFFRRRPHW